MGRRGSALLIHPSVQWLWKQLTTGAALQVNWKQWYDQKEHSWDGDHSIHGWILLPKAREGGRQVPGSSCAPVHNSFRSGPNAQDSRFMADVRRIRSPHGWSARSGMPLVYVRLPISTAGGECRASTPRLQIISRYHWGGMQSPRSTVGASPPAQYRWPWWQRQVQRSDACLKRGPVSL